MSGLPVGGVPKWSRKRAVMALSTATGLRSSNPRSRGRLRMPVRHGLVNAGGGGKGVS